MTDSATENWQVHKAAMKLEPKLDVPLMQVQRLVASQFPQYADLPVRPVEPDGWDNCTFRLGEAMAVRLPTASCYADQIAKEQAWLPGLAPQLPFPVPEPVAMGQPGEGYPFPWSINRWIDGENASRDSVTDLNDFARDLAGFLKALHRADTEGAPVSGFHCFYRGGDLRVYDRETRDSIRTLGSAVDARACLRVWEAALSSCWASDPVWVHGDFAIGNVLVKDGRLCAVIDFGGCCIGDPACDLVICWTFLEGESRQLFRSVMELEADTWMRARGWALWKALITLEKQRRHNGNNGETVGLIAELLAAPVEH